MLDCKWLSPNVFQYQMSPVLDAANTGNQTLWSPLHQKQETSNTARRLETAIYSLTFYILIIFVSLYSA
jgi:hypothetical protein